MRPLPIPGGGKIRIACRGPGTAIGLLFLVLALCWLVVPLHASSFGINVHVPPGVVLDRVVQNGTGWVRIDFLWPVVQPAPAGWDWSVYDALVDEADARGLRILAILQETPAWATAGSPGTGVPDPVAWRRFCYRAARRYHGKVAAWELWNEPNLGRFWEGTRQEYIDTILLPGARAVHEADPSALAVGPALAHLQSAHWDSWLKDCLVAGRNVLDVASHHLYPGSCSHTDVTKALDRGGSYPWDPPSVKKVLQKAGWFGRPFWLTETGMNSERCGQHDQAGFYTNLLRDWFRTDRDMSWMDRIFFYEIMDAPSDPGWGILGPWPGMEPKDAYFAYGDFIAATPVDDAEVIALSSRMTLRPEDSGVMYVVVKNTGTTVWSTAEGYRLTPTHDPFDLVADPVELPEGSAVPPGGIVSFTVPVTTPAIPPGVDLDAPLRFRLEREGLWRFGNEIHTTVWISSRTDPWPRIDGPATPPPAQAGAEVELRIRVGNPEDLSFTWQRDGVDLEDDGRFAGIHGPVLTIRRMSRGLDGWYRCLVSAGEVFTLSSETVRVRLGEEEPPPPCELPYRATAGGQAQPAATLRTRRASLPDAPLPPP
ncbi:MAG: hypothetical protein GXP47_12855 [Acidobacteria bacterium]|nr:hypothetical protein [Acidobacteriota bacterium]